jgi:FkbH-like protein
MLNEQIKLVIWDLDETLWSGTLAEGGRVAVPQSSIDIVKELTGRGIVNSICSKNDFTEARSVLEQARIWEYFVFPHIAFTPKGEAIKKIISDMQLRAPNVLFVDDNRSNLEEALFYNSGIQTLDARELDRLLSLSGTEGKPDTEHKRLKQYKMLENRRDFRESSDDNQEFLRNSDIHIRVMLTAIEDAERVHDMIMRTNQLNFTKKRISLENVAALLSDPAADSASVRVYDRFGDHGIVGWYCLRNGELEHFLFSCRIINLGIEQYVYGILGYPKITVAGNTAASLSPGAAIPDWITLDDSSVIERITERACGADLEKLQIYALGACDLYYLVSHIALPLTNVHFECNTFNGDTRGVNVATEYIRSCFEMSESEKEYCRSHFRNYTGRTVFDTKIFEGTYDYVCLSFHDDFALDIYRSKKFPNMRIVLSNSKTGSFTPILNSDGTTNPNGKEWLSRHFTPFGLISPERFRENLEWIAARLSKKTRMILMTGPEYDYFRDSEQHNPVFHEQVVRLNRVIRDFCASSPRAALVEMNDVIYERSHFTDFIMHLKPERAYALAVKMLEAMSGMPSPKGLPFQLPIGSRRLALWGEGSVLLSNWITLCAYGAKCNDVVTTTSLQSFGSKVNILAPHSLYGKNSEYFVLLAPGCDLAYQRAAMDFYGFIEGADYFELTQQPFSLEWRE